MPAVPNALLPLLAVQQHSDERFEGICRDDVRGRVFGGQVAAQALAAAIETVPGRLPHSLHAYFIRPGKASVPIDYEVARLRDGVSFSTRRVSASQAGRLLFEMLTSFHEPEPGPLHQWAMPDVPPPESCPTWEQLQQRAPTARGSVPPVAISRWPVEMRPIRLSRGPQAADSRQRYWLKTPPLPDAPAIHRVALTFVSDYLLLGVMRRPHGGAPGRAAGLQSASLDHSLWFHQQLRCDEWLLYDQMTPASADARGLGQGRFFTRDGRLVASVAQEGLLRPQGPSGAR